MHLRLFLSHRVCVLCGVGGECVYEDRWVAVFVFIVVFVCECGRGNVLAITVDRSRGRDNNTVLACS